MNKPFEVLKVTKIGNIYDFFLGACSDEFINGAGNPPSPVEDILNRFIPETYKYFTENGFDLVINTTEYNTVDNKTGFIEINYTHSLHYQTKDPELATFTILKMGL